MANVEAIEELTKALDNAQRAVVEAEAYNNLAETKLRNAKMELAEARALLQVVIAPLVNLVVADA